jgi:hypothetical protein
MTSRFTGGRTDRGGDPRSPGLGASNERRDLSPGAGPEPFLNNADRPQMGAPSTASSGSRPDLGPPSPGAQAVDQPGSGLGLILSVVIAALVLVLAIYVQGDGSADRLPLAQETNALYWGMAAVAVLLAAGGALYAERAAARAARAVGRTRSTTALPTAGTVPAIATLAAVLLVATYHNVAMLVVGPLIAFLGNAGALFSRDLLDDAGDTAQRTATTIHTLVIHAVAFLAMSAVYLNKMPTPVAAPLIGLIGGVLTLETLERGDGARETRLLYALLAGWVLALATVALNWWQTHGWTGGAVLLVCFYLASGVLLARTQRSILRGRDLVEFGVVSLLAFVLLAVTA